MWDAVKKIKLELGTDFSKLCTSSAIYYSESIMSLVEAVEKQFEIGPSVTTIENMTVDYLRTVANMFIYLNSCPYDDINIFSESAYSKELQFKSWFSFYNDLFQNKPANQIILTLNRITKAKVSQDMFGKERAKKLLKKILNLLSFKDGVLQSFLSKNKVQNVSAADVQHQLKSTDGTF